MATLTLRVVIVLACLSVTRAQVHSSGKRSLAKCDRESAGCEPKTSILLQQKREAAIFTEQALGDMSSNLGGYEQILQAGSHGEQLSILTELLKQGKALPASIKQFVDAIERLSQEVQEELRKEHGNQVESLNAAYTSIEVCARNFDAEILKIQSPDNESSPKSQAASAKETLCSRRERQAKVAAEAKQCKDTLECLKRELDSKTAALKGYLYEQNDTPVDFYEKSRVCGNGKSWTSGSGSTPADKALQWIKEQRDMFNRNMNSTQQRLQALKAAYDLARAEHDGLKDGNLEGLTIEGCDAIDRQSVAVAGECRELQTRATMAQCTYRGAVEKECQLYNTCYSDKVNDWDEEKQAGTANSKDGRAAWVAAEKIKCHTSAFYEDGEQLQINVSTIEACEKLTCASIGAACEQGLDMSEHLNKPRPQPAPCPEVPIPCGQGGWTPACNAQDWAPYTPTPIGWNRNSSCSQAPTPRTLVAAEDTCQTCDGEEDVPAP